MAVPPDKERISITLPKELSAIIKQDAKGNMRPLSKEITDIIIRYYENAGRYTRPGTNNK